MLSPYSKIKFHRQLNQSGVVAGRANATEISVINNLAGVWIDAPADEALMSIANLRTREHNSIHHRLSFGLFHPWTLYPVPAREAPMSLRSRFRD